MVAAPPVGQLPLCRGCGVVAPLEQGRCQACERELDVPRWSALAGQDGLLWAQVRVSFECRACGHRSPIDYLDVDGSVQCLSCGIEQRFENKQWWAALEQAHAVADLTGPHPEGLLPGSEPSIAKLNPHAVLGVSESAVEVERGEQSLRLSVSPGKPLCEKCHGLLVIAARGEGKLTLRCEPCGEQRGYALPKNLSQRVRALRAVIAPAHEEGRLDAVVREENGVTALRCPTCGAALTADGAGIVTCQYCRTSSRVDARVRGKSQRDATPTPFWLLFEGPSRQRGKLENRAEAELNQLRKDNQRAAQQRAEARAMDRPRQPPERNAKSTIKRHLPWVALVVLSLGFGLLVHKLEQNQTEAKERLAEASKRLQHQVTPHDQALQANEQRLAAPPEPGKPFALDLTMDVVKAEGQPLKPGAPCLVYASGFDDSVKELHVTCGSVSLYDSTAQVFGMRLMEHELYRPPSGEPPTGLRYHDTGQRTGGSEITLDTKVNQAVISSQAVPLFRVELGPHQEPKPRKAKPKSAR